MHVSHAAREQIAVALFYAVIFLTVGIFLPFMPVWLKGQGMQSDQIATLLASGMLARVAFTPFVTGFADRLPSRRLALSIYSALACFFFFCLLPAYSFFYLFVFMLLYAVFWHAQIPLADAFALTMVRRHGASYGAMRLWGSLAFIVANVAAGYALQHLGFSVIFPLMLGGLSLCVVVALILPPTDRKPLRGTGNQASSFAYMKNKPFLAIALSSGLIQASHALIYGFGTLHWQSQGHSGTAIGAFWAIGVLAEVLLFTQSRWLFARLSPSLLMAIGGVAGIVRWITLPYLDGFWEIFTLQILHGLSFGASHLAIQSYISAEISEEETATAQGAMILIGGLAMAALTAIAGRIYDGFGAEGYWFMSLTCVVGCFCLLIGRLRQKTV